MKIRLLIFILWLPFYTWSQHNSSYSQYMFNGLLFNPAYAGSNDALNLTALYRKQWVGIDNAPTTANFTAHTPLKNKKVNIDFSRSFYTKVKASKRIGPHNEDVLSIIIGSLLDNCYSNRRSIEGTRFCYKQNIIHKEYFNTLTKAEQEIRNLAISRSKIDPNYITGFSNSESLFKISI